MLPPHESITTAKETLLKALQDRGIKEINGDSIPEDHAEIELGAPVDKNDLEKGWTRLENEIPGLENGSKRGAGKKTSLKAADLRNGQSIAFRFRKPREQMDKEGDLDIDLDLDDSGWDVVLPSLDDEEEEPN